MCYIQEVIQINIMIYIYLKKGTTPKYINEIEFAKKRQKKEINLEKW